MVHSGVQEPKPFSRFIRQAMETVKITPLQKHVPDPEFPRSKKCGSFPFLPLHATLAIVLRDENGRYPQPLTGRQ
jgi:hypothetical protein